MEGNNYSDDGSLEDPLDVSENEAHPAPFQDVRKGERIELATLQNRKDQHTASEKTRRWIVVGIFVLVAGVLAAAVNVITGLPAEEAVKSIVSLFNSLLIILSGAVGYYFGQRHER